MVSPAQHAEIVRELFGPPPGNVGLAPPPGKVAGKPAKPDRPPPGKSSLRQEGPAERAEARRARALGESFGARHYKLTHVLGNWVSLALNACHARYGLQADCPHLVNAYTQESSVCSVLVQTTVVWVSAKPLP